MKKILIVIGMFFMTANVQAYEFNIPLKSINDTRVETKCVDHLLFVIVRNDRYMQVVQAYRPGDLKTNYIPQPKTCR